MRTDQFKAGTESRRSVVKGMERALLETEYRLEKFRMKVQGVRNETENTILNFIIRSIERSVCYRKVQVFVERRCVFQYHSSLWHMATSREEEAWFYCTLIRCTLACSKK